MTDSLEDRYAAVLVLARDAPPENLPSVLGRLAEAEAIVRQRLHNLAPSNGPGKQPDEHVSVEEAARRLGISTRFVYKHADRLPFIRRIGRRVLCSSRAIQDWSERQRPPYTHAR